MWYNIHGSNKCGSGYRSFGLAPLSCMKYPNGPASCRTIQYKKGSRYNVSPFFFVRSSFLWRVRQSAKDFSGFSIPLSHLRNRQFFLSGYSVHSEAVTRPPTLTSKAFIRLLPYSCRSGTPRPASFPAVLYCLFHSVPPVYFPLCCFPVNFIPCHI